MIVLGGGILGGLLGALTARKRGGSKWDIAQYATAYAIAFMLAGLILTIFIHRASI